MPLILRIVIAFVFAVLTAFGMTFVISENLLGPQNSLGIVLTLLAGFVLTLIYTLRADRSRTTLGRGFRALSAPFLCLVPFSLIRLWSGDHLPEWQDPASLYELSVDLIAYPMAAGLITGIELILAGIALILGLILLGLSFWLLRNRAD